MCRQQLFFFYNFYYFIFTLLSLLHMQMNQQKFDQQALQTFKQYCKIIKPLKCVNEKKDHQRKKKMIDRAILHRHCNQVNSNHFLMNQNSEKRRSQDEQVNLKTNQHSQLSLSTSEEQLRKEVRKQLQALQNKILSDRKLRIYFNIIKEIEQLNQQFLHQICLGQRNIDKQIQYFLVLKKQLQQKIKNYQSKFQHKKMINNQSLSLSRVIRKIFQDITDAIQQYSIKYEDNLKDIISRSEEVIRINQSISISRKDLQFVKAEYMEDIFHAKLKECTCCNQFQGTPVSIFQQKLYNIGMSLQCCFNYVKSTIQKLFYGSIISIFFIIINILIYDPSYVTGHCYQECMRNKQTVKYCTLNCQFSIKISRLTIVQKLEQRILYVIQNWILLILIMTIFILLNKFRIDSEDQIKDNDDKIITPSDFCTKFQNFNYDVLDKNVKGDSLEDKVYNLIHEIVQKNNKKLQQQQSENVLEKEEIKIVRILIPYNPENYENLKNQQIKIIQQITNQMNKLNKAQWDSKIKQYQYITNQIIQEKNRFKDIIYNYRNDLADLKPKGNCVYIVFENQSMRKKFQDSFKTNLKFKEFIRNKFKSIFCCDNHNQVRQIKKFQDIDDNIFIKRACEPEQIYWDNCCNKQTDLLIVLSLLFQTLLVFISFGIVLGLNLIKINPPPVISESKTMTRLLQYSIAGFISLFNYVISYSVRFFVNKFQKNHSKTKQLRSSCRSIFWIQCLNTVFVPIATLFTTKILSENKILQDERLKQFVKDIFILGITNIIIDIFIQILYLVYEYLRFHIECYKEFKIENMFQNQLNKFYQAPQFCEEDLYIYTARTFMFVGFYVWIQPCVFVQGLIGIFIMYYFNRLKLLRFCNKPAPLSMRLFFKFEDLSEFIVFAYGLGSLILFFILSDFSRYGEYYQYLPSLIALVFIICFKQFVSKELQLNVFTKFFSFLSFCQQQKNKKNKVQTKKKYDPDEIYMTSPFYGSNTYEQVDKMAQIIYYDERFLLNLKSKKEIRSELNKFYNEKADSYEPFTMYYQKKSK